MLGMSSNKQKLSPKGASPKKGFREPFFYSIQIGLIILHMEKEIQCEILGKYQPKKKMNLKMYEFIENKLSESGRELFESCSNFNLFITTQDKDKKKRVKGSDCKNRFCPICSWRKARKDAMKIAIMMEAIKQEKNKEFIFLTLTTPNIKADEVKNEIDRLNKAFKKLFDRAQIKKSIKGYIRKLEMTYNKVRDDYNPHFHVLLCVDKGYFSKKSLYIKQEDWLEMWRDVTDMPEITQVHVQKVQTTRGNAVAEVAKYSAKDYEMATSQDVFDVFYLALKGRQLIVYGGLLKEYAKKYEDGELDKYKGKDENVYFYKLIASWNQDLLKFNQEYQELNELEKQKYNGHLIDEMEVE